MVPTRRLMFAATLLLPFVSLRAETPADPTGHWDGAVHTPTEDILVAVDIASEGGNLVGTFSNPSQQLRGFPFLHVAVNGRSVTLELKTSDPGVQKFVGTLSGDGRSIEGEFLVSVFSVPFSLERTGDASIAPLPHGPAIDERLTGEWSASLSFGGQSLPLRLMLTNHIDDSATGSWAAGEAIATPVSIVSDGPTIALASTVTPVEFSGAVNADGTELSGTIKQGSIEQPLTFVRSAHAN
jgi:hypothetical protein